MLSNVSTLLPRAADVFDLLTQTCEVAINVGGYRAAAAALCDDRAHRRSLTCIASRAISPELAARLAREIVLAGARPGSIVARALQTGEPRCCDNPSDDAATTVLKSFMMELGVHCAVALPLTDNSRTVGVLLLVADSDVAFGQTELQLLRDVAGTVSFALRGHMALPPRSTESSIAQRQRFCQKVAEVLDAARYGARNVGVLMLDVGRLSVINDSLGREAGDAVLRLLGKRLTDIYGAQQIAQISGGTFAVIVETGTCEPCEQILRRALAAFDTPFRVELREVSASARIGGAFFPRDAAEAGALIQKAESALHTAREQGNQCVLYDAAKRSETLGCFAMEHKLRLALRQREFRLEYQPKVELTSGRVVGAEALIRWNNAELAEVPPNIFLPIVESTGLMPELGDWIIRRAAADLRKWEQSGLPALRIAVNVSTSQLRMLDFDRAFLDACGSWRDHSWGLDIEITEGVLQGNSALEIARLRNLHNAGVRIAIDDFGTGYSSLSRLGTLPIDVLKIDRSFITGIPDESTNMALVRTMVSLAGALGMTIVAEGVESAEQFTALQRLGCDQFQGYYHSRPMALEQLLSSLKPTLA
ncbi:MAG: GGDEF domain-containing protein [Proteobacteria bacterium]|nr:GGDEF domain-containing protein [Pseudomonadota bacterium]